MHRERGHGAREGEMGLTHSFYEAEERKIQENRANQREKGGHRHMSEQQACDKKRMGCSCRC